MNIITTTHSTIADGQQLQPWYSIVIERFEHEDSAHVTFKSRIHTNKEVQLPFCWSSSDFTDYQILNDPDLLKWVRGAYGEVTTNY